MSTLSTCHGSLCLAVSVVFFQVILLTSNDPTGPDALPRALADRLDGSQHLRSQKRLTTWLVTSRDNTRHHDNESDQRPSVQIPTRIWRHQNSQDWNILLEFVALSTSNCIAKQAFECQCRAGGAFFPLELKQRSQVELVHTWQVLVGLVANFSSRLMATHQAELHVTDAWMEMVLENLGTILKPCDCWSKRKKRKRMSGTIHKSRRFKKCTVELFNPTIDLLESCKHLPRPWRVWPGCPRVAPCSSWFPRRSDCFQHFETPGGPQFLSFLQFRPAKCVASCQVDPGGSVEKVSWKNPKKWIRLTV